jgi:hypothetical protein
MPSNKKSKELKKSIENISSEIHEFIHTSWETVNNLVWVIGGREELFNQYFERFNNNRGSCNDDNNDNNDNDSNDSDDSDNNDNDSNDSDDSDDSDDNDNDDNNSDKYVLKKTVHKKLKHIIGLVYGSGPWTKEKLGTRF